MLNSALSKIIEFMGKRNSINKSLRAKIAVAIEFIDEIDTLKKFIVLTFKQAEKLEEVLSSESLKDLDSEDFEDLTKYLDVEPSENVKRSSEWNRIKDLYDEKLSLLLDGEPIEKEDKLEVKAKKTMLRRKKMKASISELED